jgi:tetratricopeptide (TPR) repeat protein
MTADGNSAFAFLHALIRDAAYQLMPPSVRAALHDAAAAALESLPDDALPAASPEIANHLAAAIKWSGGYIDGNREIAQREIAACLRAGDWLAAQYRPLDAIATRERVIEHPLAAPAQRLTALLRCASACDAIGNSVHGAHFAERALTLALGEGHAVRDVAGAMILCGLFAMRSGEFARAEELFRDAIARTEAADDYMMGCRAIGNLASLCAAVGRHDEAVAGHLRVAELARARQDRVVEGLAAGNLAFAYAAMGRMDEAEQGFSNGLAIAREVNDQRSVCVCMGNLADVQFRRGLHAIAIANNNVALTVARETGNLRFEGVWLANAADMAARSPSATATDRVAAEAQFRSAIAIQGDVGDIANRAFAQGRFASLLGDLGRRDEALALYDESMAALESLKRVANLAEIAARRTVHFP